MSLPHGSPSTLTTAAAAWHAAGYCVVPSHEDGGKRPFGRWKDYQRQRPDWDQVEAWLSTGAYTGIGVLTGSASGNVEMIELEGPLDAAVERLGRVVKRAEGYAEIGVPDLLARIASGCVEQSAGGGLHLFIRVTDGPALGNTKLAFTGQGSERKVISETRGEGGFVVVAPTPARKGHPEGAAYLFINNGHPAKTVEVTAEERDILHLLFMQALNEDEDTPSVPEDAPRIAASLGGTSAFDDYRARVRWADVLVPHGWTFSHHAEGRDHWTRPGKTVHDGTSATTIEDGPMYVFSTSTVLPEGKGLSKGQVYAYLNHDGDASAAARALVAAGFGDPAPSYELPAWEAELDPDASEEEKAEAVTSWVAEHLPRVDWHALWQDTTEEEWIVEPLLAARRLVALYSAPKVGKSLLMLEVAAAVATGRPMFGYAASRAFRTLYVDFENDPRGDVRERLSNMGYGPDDLDNLVLLSFPTLGYLDTERGSQELMAAVEHYGTEIVVIDTVSRAIGGEENENDTWLKFYRHTGLKLKQAGVAMIRLDHAGKDETKGQRGGSAKSGDVDAVWRLSKVDDDLFDLICEAQRFPIAEKHLTLRRVDDGRLRHEAVGDGLRVKRDAILAALAEKRVPKDASLSLNKAKQLARQMGVKFGNKGEFSAELWSRYCQSIGSWEA